MSVSSADDEAVLQFPILIGDIGGTNARFAIVVDANSEPGETRIVQTASFASIDEAIQQAVLDHTSLRPRSAVLAVAGPVDGDEIRLTNCPWVVRPKAMFDTLGLHDVVVLNDFEAQALAVVALGEEHMEKIGPGEPEENAGRVVLGPGTGLGVAGLIHASHKWIPVPGEGGHMDIGPRTARDREIFPHLEAIEGRISGEQILCGRGLVNAYRAVAKADGKEPRFTTPAEITAAALEKSDAVAVEAVEFFVTCLGRTAGDLALVFMSRGGVYLTGGIAQKIVPALKAGNFRAAFEDKAPHSALLRDMPVYVITHPLAALNGLAAFARTPSRFGVETAGRRWQA
ncbi:glucokinase [Mesorhizobium sp. DCY119]|jgi:glucokinase|uniref:glucokinase n=1 Tax=Mesorhizobium sp. DCY119 TaxID=2108445 RepID=UPI000E6BF623|nr:glucokinase [Mesorhizobium sp. DCY119]RJG43016.1 glucokinase [Mesorhizobium sp. DCY119]